MSKRSYRRLAVVAGTALALGSTAPAMALRVNANGGGSGTANVDIQTIDVGDAVSDLQLPTIGVGAVVGAATQVQAAAFASTQALLLDVQALLGSVECAAGASLDLGVNATADAALSVSGSGIVAGTNGLATGAFNGLADVNDCVADLQTNLDEAIGNASVAVEAAGTIAADAALGALVYAGTLPGAATGIVTPILLSNILTVNANGNANAVLSGVASLF